MRKNRMLTLFFVALVLISFTCAAAVSAAISLPGPDVLQEQIDDFSSNAWQSGANRDTGFTTLKKSGSTERMLISTKEFRGSFKVRFTLIFNDVSSWDGHAKSMFTFSMSGSQTGVYTDLFVFFEQSIITGGDFDFEPGVDEFGNTYDPTLWRQPGIDGIFSGIYNIMFDVKDGTVADLYIEKYGTPLKLKRYSATATNGEVFGGHLIFESGPSGFDYEIGSLTVEYSEDGLSKTFNSEFHKPGAVATAQQKTDATTFVTNFTENNSTRKLDSLVLEPNQYLYSNFAFTGKTFSVEYEIFNIINGNHFNNTAAAIEFVAGITDQNPEGVLLGRVYKNFVSLGDHSWQDASIHDHINPGKFITDTSYKFKIEMTDGSFQVSIAPLIDDSYGEYIPFSVEDEIFSGENIGRIGVRAKSPSSSLPLTFSVRLLSVNGAIDDGIFLGTPDESVLNPSFSGSLRMLLPEVAVFNPQKADERAIWSLEDGDFASLEDGNILIASGAGELQLRLSAQSNPSVYRIFTMVIADATPPVIELNNQYILTQSGTLTESEFWDNIAATDNVSEEITFSLIEIVFYANINDAINGTNGVTKSFSGGSLALQKGVYSYTVSATDEASNTSTKTGMYFVDALTLSNTEDFGSLEFAGETIKLNLPEVTGIGGEFVFEVTMGSAAIGRGDNEGKLLIFSEGEFKITVINTLMPQLKEVFSFSVADKQVPVITAYLPEKVEVGTPLAAIRLGNLFEFSSKGGTVAAQYSVRYYKSKADMESGINGTEVMLEDGNKFAAQNTGWYSISVTANDGKGNSVSKSFSFEAIDKQSQSAGAGLGLFGWLSVGVGVLVLAGIGVLVYTYMRRRKTRA